jgi:hypothetical protein
MSGFSSPLGNLGGGSLGSGGFSINVGSLDNHIIYGAIALIIVGIAIAWALAGSGIGKGR